jgi:hypothetical protein
MLRSIWIIYISFSINCTNVLDRESDLIIKNYMMDLCGKLERKIELRLGRKFGSLNCKEAVDNYVRWLKVNNQYERIDTQDLVVNERAINVAFTGFVFGIAETHQTYAKGKAVSSAPPSNLLSVRKGSYLNKYQYNHFRIFMSTIISNLINSPEYQNKSLQKLVSISKSIPDRYIVSLSQEMSRLNTDFLHKLEDPPTVITDKVIDEYCEIYAKGCMCLEKYIKISFKFVNDIKGNKKIPFKDVRRTDVYRLKTKLEQSDRNFEGLLRPFSTIIWNSIKHGENIKVPSTMKITFQSNDGKRIRSYNGFMRSVGQLFSVIFLLSRFSRCVLLPKLAATQ